MNVDLIQITENHTTGVVEVFKPYLAQDDNTEIFSNAVTSPDVTGLRYLIMTDENESRPLKDFPYAEVEVTHTY